MIAAMLLAAALVWLAIAVGAGVLLYRWRRKRWQQVAMTLFVIWLPFWDVIPGYYFYQKAVREVGGVRIYRTVQAEGYLDLTSSDCNACWTWLKERPGGYLEVQRTGSSGLLYNIEQGAGYYTYRLLPSDDDRCDRFDSLPNAERLRSIYGLEHRCVWASFSAVPSSQYQLSSGSYYYKYSTPLWPVEITWRRVSDQLTEQVLAESVQVYFYSRLSYQIEIPSWGYTTMADGRQIGFRVEEILRSS